MHDGHDFNSIFSHPENNPVRKMKYPTSTSVAFNNLIKLWASLYSVNGVLDRVYEPVAETWLLRFVVAGRLQKLVESFGMKTDQAHPSFSATFLNTSSAGTG